MMKLPTLERAQRFLNEAAALNPGPWVSHSKYVAEAAKAIASADSELNPEYAYVLGLLHDIGRREGNTALRHIIDGYNFLCSAGYEDAGRICLTHSFHVQNTEVAFGEWDCTESERNFVDQFINEIEYTNYDELIQLCDALAVADGFILMEKRMVDAAIRYGTNHLTAEKWRAMLQLKEYFDQRIGKSIYSVLPGVIENTFGITKESASG